MRISHEHFGTAAGRPLPLGPPAAHLVWNTPVLAHELEALVGNALGDRGDRAVRLRTSKVPPDLLNAPC